MPALWSYIDSNKAFAIRRKYKTQTLSNVPHLCNQIFNIRKLRHPSCGVGSEPGHGHMT